MDSLLSIVITVVSGVLVYIAGEKLQTIWLTPLQKFKELKHEVAITLTFYAREYTNIVDADNVDMTTREEYANVSDKIRTLSCELKGYIETLSWFKIGIPSKKNLIKASETLMGLSNSLFSPYNTKPTTKERLENLEKQKNEIAAQIVKEELAKPTITKEKILFWFDRFRRLNTKRLDHKRRLIDSFVNSVYLYDDKVIITFNYKDGSKTISLGQIENTVFNSDINARSLPKTSPSHLRWICFSFVHTKKGLEGDAVVT